LEHTEFRVCQDDEARIRFLYNRLWQRPPREDELKIGLEFVTRKRSSATFAPAENSVKAASTDSNQGRKFGARFAERQPFRKAGGPGFRRREPLKIWEEYAHALLQANETSFVN